MSDPDPRLLGFLSALRCPVDGGAFVMATGGIACARCGRLALFRDGLLHPPLPELNADPGGQAVEEAVRAERECRDRQATRYDRMPALRLFGLAEVPAVLRRLRPGPGQRILEAGCGTGRFTARLAAAGAVVAAVDHSRESLRVLAARLPPGAPALPILGDVRRLPLADGWAHAALSAQVLEHLPSAEARAAHVAELRRVLRPGGRLVLTAYRHVRGVPGLSRQNGVHPGGIPFHRFGAEELRLLLAQHFTVRSITGGLLYLLTAEAVRPSGEDGDDP